MRLIKIFAFIISLILIIFVGTCLVFMYGFYSPQEITQHKALSKITNVDFPKVKMHDWVLSENGVDNCYYWIHASFEELPNEEFYTSIENLISKGNEHWKEEGDTYIFQKEKFHIIIKKYKLGIQIVMYEFFSKWE